MFVTLATLLPAVSAAGPGYPVACPQELPGKSVGIQVSGTFVGTVILEGTIATQAEVNGATAAWTAITGASWTVPALASLTLAYTHIRANVTAYTSGSITVRAI